jgi:hypothetical protein
MNLQLKREQLLNRQNDNDYLFMEDLTALPTLITYFDNEYFRRLAGFFSTDNRPRTLYYLQFYIFIMSIYS